MRLPIYLDNHATTPVDPRVLEAMLPYFTQNFGNPASGGHQHGLDAREAVEHARDQIGRLAGAEPAEVIFTSGATESINLVLKGIARNRAWSEIHIVTSVTEHSAVLDTSRYLESLGARLTLLPVEKSGLLDLDSLEQILKTRPTIVSLLHANNEIGTIQPLEAIGKLCRSYEVPLHVDAAQSYGKIPIRFRDWGIDFLSISGHKLYAPKGVGCVIIRRQVPPHRLTPLMHGGSHERGFRSGTLNVPAIVGLGEASGLCESGMHEEAIANGVLRDMLLNGLGKSMPDMVINGTMDHRLPGNLNVSFPGIPGQFLLPALRDHFSVSSGSACTSAHPRPSHVLAALGQSDELAHASLRFGIGRFNTREEIEYVIQQLPVLLDRLKSEHSIQ